MAWHQISRIFDHIYRISEPLGEVEPRFGIATVNMYLVLGQERAALIDSGMGIGDLQAEIRKITSLPCLVLNTHSHWDHVGANAQFGDCAIHAAEVAGLAQAQDVGDTRQAMQSSRARAVLPPDFDPATYRIQPTQASRILADGDIIDLGGRALQVIHTPGHSPGHVAFLDRDGQALFTGDVAYRGPIFICFDGCDPAGFVGSLKRLADLPEVATLCPGHNDLITDPDWLKQLLGYAGAVVGGQMEGMARDGFLSGREFQFDDCSIWLTNDE